MFKNNIIVVDKPKGKTSNDIVQFVKRKYNLKKVGHAGTLDPNATGVLVLGLNEGTKLLSKLILEDKEYIATIQFGYQTDTYDLEGKITNISKDKIDKEKLFDILNKYNNFEFDQLPPIYSAIKVNGKKLYEYARDNKEVKLEPRKVKIFNNEILSFDEVKNILIIKLKVSKGFYIRSFANDLGIELNNYATLIDLRRTASGNYTIEQAINVFE